MYVGDEELRVYFADKSTHFHSPLGICQALPSTCALSHVIPNRFIGRVMMYGLFVMMAILLWSSLSKAIFVVPAFWTLETAQFALVAYYLVGGPYSIQLGSNVRMDLFYGAWSDRRKAWFDSITVILLIFYLCVMLYGGIDSTAYAFEYNERSPSLWRPLMWPIKVTMCIGIFLMLLQAISELFKDIAKIRGVEL